VAVHFVREQGEWLEVETPGSDPDPRAFCVATHWDSHCAAHPLAAYRLRALIPRASAVEAVSTLMHVEFPDGTAATLQSGLPAQSSPSPDGGVLFEFRSRIAEGGGTRAFALPLEPNSIGPWFDSSSTYERTESGGPYHLKPDATAQLAGMGVQLLSDDEWQPSAAVALKGRFAFVTLRDRCDTLRVRILRSQVERPDVHGGGDALTIGDRALCTHEARWRVQPGAPVFWKSGNPAGTVTVEDDFTTEPALDKGRLCFSDGLQGIAVTPPLCFEARDVVQLHPGRAGELVVSPCPSKRGPSTASFALDVPLWAGDPSADGGTVAECDVAAGGKATCCDLPSMPVRSETLIRAAIVRAIPQGGQDGGLTRVRMILRFPKGDAGPGDR
jgi:hypothetical protein